MSRTQAILVVVQGMTLLGITGRIGRPKYKNPKIRKERGEKSDSLQVCIGYCSHVRPYAGTSLYRGGNTTEEISSCTVLYIFEAFEKDTFGGRPSWSK
jgi:hypothetical protein